jgi:hypothetical protein
VEWVKAFCSSVYVLRDFDGSILITIDNFRRSKRRSTCIGSNCASLVVAREEPEFHQTAKARLFYMVGQGEDNVFVVL